VKKPSNLLLGVGLGLLVGSMFWFAYANVPLFKLFCARFGIGGAGKAAWKGDLSPGLSSATGPISNRYIRVTFMGVSSSGLPIHFEPSVPSVDTNPGRSVHVDYTFTNMSDDSVFFRAVHSIVPERAAREFQLMKCFCFEDQALGPRETRKLPVYFALSPRTPPEVQELSLNYTLFPRDPKKNLPVSAKDAN
jgi:cytochrome c oxidase assembly protein subunit 11